MLIALHSALNQLIGTMLGMALTVGGMTNMWQEQYLPILRVAASAGVKVAPGVTHTADTHPVYRSDPATCDCDLILAAQASNTMAIQSLLVEDTSLKTCDADGRTALAAAAMAHMGATTRLFIQTDVDVNLQGNTQNSAFLLAASQGDTETVRLALPHGANLCVINADSDTTSIPAARHGYVEVVSELVRAGVSPDTTNNPDLTVLIEAVASSDGSDKYEKTVQILLDGGADPNLADRGGVTPMWHVRQRGFHGIGVLLFKACGHWKRGHSDPFS